MPKNSVKAECSKMESPHKWWRETEMELLSLVTFGTWKVLVESTLKGTMKNLTASSTRKRFPDERFDDRWLESFTYTFQSGSCIEMTGCIGHNRECHRTNIYQSTISNIMNWTSAWPSWQIITGYFERKEYTLSHAVAIVSESVTATIFRKLHVKPSYKKVFAEGFEI